MLMRCLICKSCGASLASAIIAFSHSIRFSAGGPIDNNITNNSHSINAPPLSVLKGQRLEQEVANNENGDSATNYILHRDLVGVSSSYTDEFLTTIFYDISVDQESLYAGM